MNGTTYKTAEQRWKAVQTRDKAADGAFIYAVVTTRIYCRPTCPARLARRANVLFFDTPADAKAASFRPCKRCKPDEAVTSTRATQLVHDAQMYIRARRGEATLDQVADHLGISSRYLHHIFSRSVGCTPAAYASIFKTKSGSMSIPGLHIADSTVRSTPIADSSPGSRFSGPDDLHTQYSTPLTETWSDLNNFDSSLMNGDAEMMWCMYDQSIDDLNADSWWDLVDFDSTILNSTPICSDMDFLSS